MLVAWASTENIISQMIRQELALPINPKEWDEKTKRQFKYFKSKITFLQGRNRLTAKDVEILLEFAKERNKYFHGEVFRLDFSQIPEAGKTRLMELASKASQIATNRGFGLWYDEGTSDIENKEYQNSRSQKRKQA